MIHLRHVIKDTARVLRVQTSRIDLRVYLKRGRLWWTIRVAAPERRDRGKYRDAFYMEEGDYDFEAAAEHLIKRANRDVPWRTTSYKSE